MHTKNSIAKTTTAVVAALAAVALLMGVLAWAADDNADESAIDISGATIAYVVTDNNGDTATTTDAQTYTYTGSEPDITLSVTLGETTLTEDDYEVTYYSVTVGDDGSYTVGEALTSEPTDVGTYAISVAGTGNYTGTVSTTTTTYDEDETTVETDDETYDETYGSTYGSTYGETEGETYDETYGATEGETDSDADEGDEATTTTTYLYFTIEAKSIEGGSLTVANNTYDGNVKAPQVSVTVDSTALTASTDYTVTYTTSDGTDVTGSIVDAGTYTVIATGIGNYTGTLSATFTVTKADQDISYAETSVTKTYGDDVFLNTLTVTTLDTNGGATIAYSSSDKSVASVDSSGKVAVKSVGSSTITATASATDNYSSVTASYALTVGRLDFSGSASIELSATELTFDGTEQTPTATVTVGDEELTCDSDYTLSYANNTNIGTATVTATGAGNYTGTVSTTFTISAASISGATVTVGELTYDDTSQSPEVTVTLGSSSDATTLTETNDYTLAYYTDSECTTQVSKIKDAGTYYVTVTGTGNYTGTATGSFTVDPLELTIDSISTLSVSATSYTYTGSAIDPGISSVITTGGLSLDSDDYDVTYWESSSSDSLVSPTQIDGAPTDVGTHYYALAFKGNFTGTTNSGGSYYTYSITAATVSGASLEVSEVTYTGATPELSLSFTDSSGNDVELTGSDFYTVTYYAATTTQPDDTTGYETYSDGTTTWYYTTTDTTDATDVGTYIAVVTLDGTNVTTGTDDETITVVVTVVKGDAIDGVSASDVTYTGSAVTPELTFSISGTETTLASGYSVTCYAATDETPSDTSGYSTCTDSDGVTWYYTTSDTSGATDVGTYVAVVSSTNTDNVTFSDGTNDYLVAKFSVTKATSTGATLALSETSYTYTGSAQVPDATVTLATGDVVPSSDYEITYVNASGTTVASPTDASTYTATATFTGTNVSTDEAPTATFEIVAADQTLSFSSSTQSVHISDSVTAPTLSGAQTTVTYASSVTSVATVNSSTGAVTIAGAGTATITATAAATTNYNAASASWTLTVTGHSWSTSPTWSWSGYTSASATFTCSNSSCTVKTQTVTATITSQTTDATYTSSGKAVYTATVTFDGTTYTDTQTVTIAQLSKLTNGLSAKAKKVKAKGKYNKKKKLKKDITIGASSYVTVSGANGTVTYALAKNVSGIKLSSNKGEITLKKKKFKKKETVKLTVNITAAGDTNHNAKTVAVTVKIKLK